MKKMVLILCGAIVLLTGAQVPAVADGASLSTETQVAWYVAPRGVVVRPRVVEPVVRAPVVVTPAPEVVTPAPEVVVPPERVVHPAVRAAGVVRRVDRRRVREALR